MSPRRTTITSFRLPESLLPELFQLNRFGWIASAGLLRLSLKPESAVLYSVGRLSYCFHQSTVSIWAPGQNSADAMRRRLPVTRVSFTALGRSMRF